MGYKAREARQNSLALWKKNEFQIVFAETSRAKFFRPPKNSSPVNYDVASAAKQKKQMDLTIALVGR